MDNITYVETDLHWERPLEALVDHGYNADVRTLFICSGLLMYLEEKAVNQVFAFVHNAEQDNSIIFDYVYKSVLEGDTNYFGARMVKEVEKRGEPLRFGISEGMVKNFLEERGFYTISDFSPEELERAYLIRGNGKQRGRVVGFWGIVHAGIDVNAKPKFA